MEKCSVVHEGDQVDLLCLCSCVTRVHVLCGGHAIQPNRTCPAGNSGNFKKHEIIDSRPRLAGEHCVRSQQESLSARQTPQRLAVRIKAEKCFSALKLNVEIDVQILFGCG